MEMAGVDGRVVVVVVVWLCSASERAHQQSRADEPSRNRLQKAEGLQWSDEQNVR